MGLLRIRILGQIPDGVLGTVLAIDGSICHQQEEFVGFAAEMEGGIPSGIVNSNFKHAQQIAT